MVETYVIHSVPILDQMDDDHFAIGDLDGSNAIGSLPPDEGDPHLATAVLLLGMVRELSEDNVLVLRKEVKL